VAELAKAQLTTMIEIAAYVDSHKARVANGSFGTGYPQAKMIASLIGKPLKLSEEEIVELAKHFIATLNKEGVHFVGAASNTLFVFAAGNDGLSNDDYGSFPTSIKADNVISVAATLKPGMLARFSNFGTKTVDVAAPGVAIESTVPDNMYLKVSGTSQAAPFVANMASRIAEINNDLSPKAIKKIIMNTVDKRRGYKVRSSGDVNMERALIAAQNTIKMNLDTAIAQSHLTIKTIINKDQSTDGTLREGYVLPMPSPFVIK
jgi:cell wall-associated protease